MLFIKKHNSLFSGLFLGICGACLTLSTIGTIVFAGSPVPCCSKRWEKPENFVPLIVRSPPSWEYRTIPVWLDSSGRAYATALKLHGVDMASVAQIDEYQAWEAGDGVQPNVALEISFYDPGSDKLLGKIRRSGKFTGSLCISPNKKLATIEGKDLGLWNIEQCRFMRVVGFRKSAALSFSGDSRHLLVLEEFRLISVDVESGRIEGSIQIGLMAESTRFLLAAFFDSDGSPIAVICDSLKSQIEMHNLYSGKMNIITGPDGHLFPTSNDFAGICDASLYVYVNKNTGSKSSTIAWSLHDPRIVLELGAVEIWNRQICIDSNTTFMICNDSTRNLVANSVAKNFGASVHRAFGACFMTSSFRSASKLVEIQGNRSWRNLPEFDCACFDTEHKILVLVNKEGKLVYDLPPRWSYCSLLLPYLLFADSLWFLLCMQKFGKSIAKACRDLANLAIFHRRSMNGVNNCSPL